MQTKYWAKRGNKQIGPCPTRETALAEFREKYPFTKALYLATAKANEIMTGYGEYGLHFDVRWHAARELPKTEA